jgi:hypothetical protein
VAGVTGEWVDKRNVAYPAEFNRFTPGSGPQSNQALTGSFDPVQTNSRLAEIYGSGPVRGHVDLSREFWPCLDDAQTTPSPICLVEWGSVKICRKKSLAMVPLMIAGLRQSPDSRQLLGSALNSMLFSINKMEIKFSLISFNYLLTVDFSKNTPHKTL